MQRTGRITVRGIVQGVGFRPFVFAQAEKLGISGTVKNLGSEVEIVARGEPAAFDAFLAAVSRGPLLARIDSVVCTETDLPVADGFVILTSGTGTFSGMTSKNRLKSRSRPATAGLTTSQSFNCATCIVLASRQRHVST